MNWTRSAVVSLAALMSAMILPATAQYQPLMNPLVRTTIPQVIQCPGCNKARQKASSVTQAVPAPSNAVAANAVSLRFTPNLATRKRNLANFVSKMRAQSPGNAAQMEQMFRSTDIFAVMAQGLAPMGLRVDNVADAYATYWITAWEASRGIGGQPTPRAQAQAVKMQAAKGLLIAPEFARATPIQKQEFAEALLIQAALISASMEGAAGDDAQLEAVGAAVRKGASAMGLELAAMELGPNGFGPAK
jgi:hypothetical protein